MLFKGFTELFRELIGLLDSLELAIEGIGDVPASFDLVFFTV